MQGWCYRFWTAWVSVVWACLWFMGRVFLSNLVESSCNSPLTLFCSLSFSFPLFHPSFTESDPSLGKSAQTIMWSHSYTVNVYTVHVLFFNYMAWIQNTHIHKHTQQDVLNLGMKDLDTNIMNNNNKYIYFFDVFTVFFFFFFCMHLSSFP